jgi:uncharacterized protein involved in cysteine biosynthesis
MVSPALITCSTCGFHATEQPCPFCSGTLRALDGRGVVNVSNRRNPLQVLAGFHDVRRALFALLHGKEFIGLLRLPVAMNVFAFTLLVVGGWLLLSPLFAAAFATPWWLFDGVRQHFATTGSALWLCASWLLLGPPLLDLIAGPAQEPLRLAIERRMLGTVAPRTPSYEVLRLHDRARLLLRLLLLWPVSLAVVLVPWLGLPLVIAFGAAVAAIVWLEPPMAARGLGLRSRLRCLLRQRWRCLGVGAGIQLAAAVPFVNLLALAPIATIAATATYLQFDKRE